VGIFLEKSRKFFYGKTVQPSSPSLYDHAILPLKRSFAGGLIQRLPYNEIIMLREQQRTSACTKNGISEINISKKWAVNKIILPHSPKKYIFAA
jgi:hypothetical protein